MSTPHQHHVKVFNEKHPVGSPVWYWQTTTFGPVYETTVRQPASMEDGSPVVWLASFNGAVPLKNVREIREENRNTVNPVKPGCGFSDLVAECDRQIFRAMSALKAWRNWMVPGFGDFDHLRIASEHLKHASEAAESAYKVHKHEEATEENSANFQPPVVCDSPLQGVDGDSSGLRKVHQPNPKATPQIPGSP